MLTLGASFTLSMKHYRIIGSIWLLFAITGVALSIHECVRLLRIGESPTEGAIVSTFVGSGFCAAVAVNSIGILCVRLWARIFGSVLAVLFGLYCLSFILMVGSEFGAFWLAFAFLGVLFVGYTLFVIWVFAPHDEA